MQKEKIKTPNVVSKVPKKKSPNAKVSFSLHSVLSKTDRKRMNFPGSPSKCKKSHSRFYDLKRISKEIAVKVLSYVSPKPEKVLLRGAVPDNPTIKSLIQAFKQAEDNVQSLLCLDYSKKAIEKVMGISVSWYLYTESRFLAKHIGPGGDLPDLPYRTLTFSEKELTEVVSFICAKKKISGLAWGCHEFKTLDNINVRFGSENFTNIRNVIQKICSVSRIFQRKQSHMFESLQMKLRFF